MAKNDQESSEDSEIDEEELLKTLVDYSNKENWDKFYSLCGSDAFFEWYADFSRFGFLLSEHLLWKSSELEKSLEKRVPAKKPQEVTILVPGCGTSRLSELMYDLGFQNIINFDFSKVAITYMLKKYVRDKPRMVWRVMDMTDMNQFASESFYAVVDKGGLDSLMEPKLFPRLGNLYLSEVKRVIAAGGKFICITFAEPHVLDILFHKFRFGWKMIIYTINQVAACIVPELQTFVVVLEKECPTSVSDISSFVDKFTVDTHGDRAREFREALDKERSIREDFSTGINVVYTLEDLRLGAKGDIAVMAPGRRIKLIIGEPGVSKFSYNCVLLDATNQAETKFLYQYAVYVVPQLPVYKWLITSEEGHWKFSAKSRAARSLVVFLDSSNSCFSMNDIKMDLSPLVKQLTPANYDSTVEIPILALLDGIKQQESVLQIMSDVSGLILVEDVTHQPVNTGDEGFKYRRLTFQTAETRVHSETLLSTKGSSQTERETTQEASSSGEMEVVHNFSPTLYHHGILSGIMLISSHFGAVTSHRKLVKTVVLGLGSGLLPMLMKRTLPFLKIEVVELDPMVLSVAKEYFGLEEDDRLQVHIADEHDLFKKRKAVEPEDEFEKVDIFVVDVKSSDPSDGMTCPDAGFVDDSFMLVAKESISEKGLLIINLVSRSSSLKEGVYLRMKKVFSNVFRIKVEEDVSELLFALKTEPPLNRDQLSLARGTLATSLMWAHNVVEFSTSFRPLT